MHMWGWMSGWGWFGMAMMLVTLVALVTVAAVVVARLLGPRDQGSSGDRDRPGSGDRPAERSAMEILRARLASGEIDEEEFQRRRALLSG